MGRRTQNVTKPGFLNYKNSGIVEGTEVSTSWITVIII